MLKRILSLLAVACAATALQAAENPFVGAWKLNPSKSTLIDKMKVESVGGNKYAFDFVGGNPETIAADGTDQPGAAGTTLAVTMEGPDSWKVVRKKDGRMLLTASWKLSKDGKTLTDAFTSFALNGSSSTVNFVYKKTAGTEGFAGTWESTSVTPDSVFLVKIQPYEGDGLSFIGPAFLDISQEETKNVKFDGKDYPSTNPNMPAGLTSSAQRINERTLELSDKFKGKPLDTQQVELSADHKTLTVTVQMAGPRKPNVLVFERQ